MIRAKCYNHLIYSKRIDWRSSFILPFKNMTSNIVPRISSQHLIRPGQAIAVPATPTKDNVPSLTQFKCTCCHKKNTIHFQVPESSTVGPVGPTGPKGERGPPGETVYISSQVGESQVIVSSRQTWKSGVDPDLGVPLVSPNNDEEVKVTTSFVVGADRLNGSVNQPRMFWHQPTSSFRSGTAEIAWNPNKLGKNSAAFGAETVAEGEQSFSTGTRNVASGVDSVTIGGSSNKVNGEASTILSGKANDIIQGDSSTVIGSLRSKVEGSRSSSISSSTDAKVGNSTNSSTLASQESTNIYNCQATATIASSNCSCIGSQFSMFEATSASGMTGCNQSIVGASQSTELSRTYNTFAASSNNGCVRDCRTSSMISSMSGYVFNSNIVSLEATEGSTISDCMMTSITAAIYGRAEGEIGSSMNGGVNNTLGPSQNVTGQYNTINGGSNNQVLGSVSSNVAASTSTSVQDCVASSAIASTGTAIDNSTNSMSLASTGIDSTVDQCEQSAILAVSDCYTRSSSQALVQASAHSQVRKSNKSAIIGSEGCSIDDANDAVILGAKNIQVNEDRTTAVENLWIHGNLRMKNIRKIDDHTELGANDSIMLVRKAANITLPNLGAKDQYNGHTVTIRYVGPANQLPFTIKPGKDDSIDSGQLSNPVGWTLGTDGLVFNLANGSVQLIYSVEDDKGEWRVLNLVK